MKTWVFFGVSERSYYNWKKAGAPVSDARKLLVWLRNQPRARDTKSVAARLGDPHVLRDLQALLGGDEDEADPSVTAEMPSAQSLNVEEQDTGDDARNLERGRLNKINLESRRLRFQIAKDAGLYMLRSQVQEAHQEVAALFSAELEAMVGSLPGQLAGLDEAAIKTRLKARIGVLLTTLKDRCKAQGVR